MVRDSWGRQIEYVRVSLTEACNFCCPYCRPEEITPESQTNLVSVKEWLVILEAFHKLGVKAVRLTGGEPLLYPNLDELLGTLKEKAWFEDISMTTNGSLLANKVERLKELGLDRLNISLDSVEEETFNLCTGRKGQLNTVVNGIEAALKQNFKAIKINTVLATKLSDDAVQSLLSYMEEWPVIWRFIEYMPFQGDSYKGPTFEEWKAQLERITGAELKPVEETTGFGPATYYQLPNGRKVGFIFPMSHSYCDHCNRVRLTSDGKIRLCLLRDEEVDLVSRVRDGCTSEALAEELIQILQLRREQHDGEMMSKPERGMWRIGG